MLLEIILLTLWLCPAHTVSQPRTAYPSLHLTSGPGCQQPRAIPPDEKLRLSFSLSVPTGMVDSAVMHLHSISNPDLEGFGRHWTARQVNRFFASPRQQVRDLVQWLEQSRVSYENLALDVDHLVLDTTRRGAEMLLDTTYQEYICNGTRSIFSGPYYLPESISDHVDFVSATVTGGKPRPEDGTQAETPRVRVERREPYRRARQVNCFKYTTPDCLRLLYGISPSTAPPHPNNSIGVYLSDGLAWRGEDLDRFFGDFQPDLVSRRPVMLPINGGYRDPDAESLYFHLEPNLDLGYSMALVDPLPVTNIQVGDKFLRGNLNTMLFGFDERYYNTSFDDTVDPAYPDAENVGGYNASDRGNRSPPLVISISFAQPEARLPERYVRRQCIEFLKLGLQGITVLAGSGDTGPASSQGSCIDRESGTLNTTTGIFSPNFPASCPWVTAVGGSQLSAANRTWESGAQFPPETAFRWERPATEDVLTSGGGFSRVFETPAYQSRATEIYLHHSDQVGHLRNLTSAGYMNPAGRGYPDISALANGYLMYVRGELHQVVGTSASTPVVASMIAKINDARMHAGKGSVGFINPTLYQYASQFVRDITTGHNLGCGLSKAYPATQGWDAVTGLGSVDFQKLLELYLRLP